MRVGMIWMLFLLWQRKRGQSVSWIWDVVEGM